MPFRPPQPIPLLARAERRDPSAAPEGPFLVAVYAATDDPERDGQSCPPFRETGRFERLCDAVAFVIEGHGDRDNLIDVLDDLEASDSSDDDDDSWEKAEERDALSFEELRARLVSRVPELAPLESLDYLSFALEGTLELCVEEGQSPWLDGVERCFPGWRFHLGWGALPPRGDTGVAILVPER